MHSERVGLKVGGGRGLVGVHSEGVGLKVGGGA